MNIDWDKFTERAPVNTLLRICDHVTVDFDSRRINASRKEGVLVAYKWTGPRVRTFKNSSEKVIFHKPAESCFKVRIVGEMDERAVEPTHMEYLIDNQWLTFDEVMG